MTPKVTVTFDGRSWPSVWPEKFPGSLEVNVTYSMTPKVTVTFVVDSTKNMTPKGHRVMRRRHDQLYDPKEHGNLCGRFDLVYDLNWSLGH